MSDAEEAVEGAGKKRAMMVVAEDDGEMKPIAACWKKADAIRAAEDPNFATHTSLEGDSSATLMLVAKEKK